MVLRTNEYVDRWLLFGPQYYGRREVEFCFASSRLNTTISATGSAVRAVTI